MTSYNILEIVTPSSAAEIRPEEIAGAEEIRKVRSALSDLRAPMTLCRLDAEQRASLGPTGTVSQMELALCCVRLLEQRPDIAELAQVDVDLLRELQDKELALLKARIAADSIADAAEDGELFLGAALTECNLAIERSVETLRTSPDLPREEGDRLRVLFAGSESLSKKIQDRAAAHRGKKARDRELLSDDLAAREKERKRLLAREQLASAPLPEDET